jgi:hypothetical protein
MVEGLEILREMPAELRRDAEMAGSGELLWPAHAVRQAVVWATSHGRAVTGIEIYAPRCRASGSFVAELPVARIDAAYPTWADRVLTSGQAALAALADRRLQPRSSMADARYFVATIGVDAAGATAVRFM